MDAEKLSHIQNSLDNLSIAVGKLVKKRIISDNGLDWIEGKATGL